MDKISDAAEPAAMNESISRGAPVLPVSLLVSSARLIIEGHLGLAWISGEVSNFIRASSGHCYFVLKDEKAQVRCVLFRHKSQHLEVTLRDGLSVEVRATPTLYEARGEFQLNVESVRLAGLGVLFEKFARLKAKLEADGWFRPERKRALSPFPRVVGIVTSTRAAALRDVLTTLERRLPALPVIVYPTAVQGEGAPCEIAAAIGLANERAEVDVLIVCRGGGSIEDLWAFNEQIVARAIFDSAIPVVSGIGHETDFTICDFVADARAPTPTAAAVLATPDRAALRASAAAIAARWRRAAARALELSMQRLDLASRRLVHPAARLAQQRATLAVLAARLTRAAREANVRRARDASIAGLAFVRTLRAPSRDAARVDQVADRWRRSASRRVGAIASVLEGLNRSLRHLDPLGVLDRGYSIVTHASGAIVTDAAALSVGEALNVRFARGDAVAQVTRRTPDDRDKP